jgi:hypothetical protein
MKFKSLFLIMVLGILAFLAAACSRDGVREPLPSGPSTSFRTFTLTANPNILYVGRERRPTSEVKVVLREGGRPVMNAVVYFTVISGRGTFKPDYADRLSVQTNEYGVASAILVGPIQSEISGSDFWITVQALLQTPTPDYVSKEVDIRVLRIGD